MEESLKILYEGSEGAEITEKKSRFIAHVFPISSEEEANNIIESVKKKYWDARHNCYAYVCGDKNQLQRFSDDGEPGGTAGKPILEVILGEQVHNCLVIVTRYFGGVLLGTGGLVRAYGKTAKAGLLAATVKLRVQGKKITLMSDYNDFGKIQYTLESMKISYLVEYTDNVKITIQVSKSQSDGLKKKIIEVTCGKAIFKEDEECQFLEDIHI